MNRVIIASFLTENYWLVRSKRNYLMKMDSE